MTMFTLIAPRGMAARMLHRMFPLRFLLQALLLTLAALPWSAHAFDLNDLQTQLRATPVCAAISCSRNFCVRCRNR